MQFAKVHCQMKQLDQMQRLVFLSEVGRCMIFVSEARQSLSSASVAVAGKRNLYCGHPYVLARTWRWGLPEYRLHYCRQQMMPASLAFSMRQIDRVSDDHPSGNAVIYG